MDHDLLRFVFSYSVFRLLLQYQSPVYLMEYQQTQKEEFWNTLSHAFGFVLALFGVWLLWSSIDFHNDKLLLVLSLYSASLVLLYAASTLYHYTTRIRLKHKLRVLDHISIYFLIAGTYSPIVLTVLEDSNGTLLFYLVWIIAAFGVILKLFFTGRFEKISLLLYLVMGWLIALDGFALFEKFSSVELAMLIAGGLFYSVGIYFYVKQSMLYNHVIWHIFVLLGSFFHYLMIYFSIA